MACIKYIGIEEGQFQFIIDMDSDINNLPTSTTKGANGENCVSKGSMAMSISSGSIFVLNSSDVWTEVGG